MKHIGIHEFNNLNDYDSLIVSGEITMKKCKVAAEILHNEHFSRSEDSKDFERYLAWTYRTSESLMEILLDYIDEMEDIISGGNGHGFPVPMFIIQVSPKIMIFCLIGDSGTHHHSSFSNLYHYTNFRF